MYKGTVPNAAAGLRLWKILPNGDARSCELVIFENHWNGVETTLRRAAISGRVEIEPYTDKGGDHYVDIYDADQAIISTAALDADSYRSLKRHWMRCKYVD